jgi:hypothetical protein
MTNFTLSELDNMTIQELRSIFNRVSRKLAREQQHREDCSATIAALQNIQIAILQKIRPKL